jgi:hypothetical protein
MEDADRRSFEMLVRVRDLGATNASAFPDKSRGAELFAALGATISELDIHATVQTSGKSAAQTGTASKATARAALQEDLEAIRRTARAIALDNPAFANNFRLPRGRLNDQQLLTTARAFAADAAPLAAEFIHNELPADFLADLNADIESFARAGTTQNTSTEAHVAATKAIDAAIERGLTIVRQLDAVVRNKFRADPATLAAWTSASHVERAPQHKKPQPKPADAPAQQ